MRPRCVKAASPHSSELKMLAKAPVRSSRRKTRRWRACGRDSPEEGMFARLGGARGRAGAAGLGRSRTKRM